MLGISPGVRRPRELSRENPLIGVEAEDYIKWQYMKHEGIDYAIEQLFSQFGYNLSLPVTPQEILEFVQTPQFKELGLSDQFISSYLIYPSGRVIPFKIFFSDDPVLPSDGRSFLEKHGDQWRVDNIQLPCLGFFDRMFYVPLYGIKSFYCADYEYEPDSYSVYRASRTFLAPHHDMAIHYLMTTDVEIRDKLLAMFGYVLTPNILEQLDLRYSSVECHSSLADQSNILSYRTAVTILCSLAKKDYFDLAIIGRKFITHTESWFIRPGTPSLQEESCSLRGRHSDKDRMGQISVKSTKRPTGSRFRRQRERVVDRSQILSNERYIEEQINMGLDPQEALDKLRGSRHQQDRDNPTFTLPSGVVLSPQFIRKWFIYPSGRNRAKFTFLSDIPSISFNRVRYLSALQDNGSEQDILDINSNLTHPGYLIENPNPVENPLVSPGSVENPAITPVGGPGSVENPAITPVGGPGSIENPAITPIPCTFFDNQPLYVPVLRYALKRPESYREHIYCGTYYYFDEGPQLYLKSNKTLIVPTPAHAYFYLNGGDATAAQMLLDIINTDKDEMFSREIPTQPSRDPSLETEEFAKQLQFEMTNCGNTDARIIYPYSAGGHFEQLLCRLGRRQNYDLIIVSYSQSHGLKHNITEIIDVRSREESFANLAWRLP